MKIIFCTLILIILPFGLFGQSITGTNGLFKVPSAYVAPDGNSYIGVSFYPKGYYEYLNAGTRFTGMPTFITLSLYDRVEFMFRYTHQLGHEVNPQTEYFPDRMFTVRYKVLNESNKYPAITIGLHDISEALGSTTAKPWFLSTYIVGTKSVDINNFSIASSFGYAYDIFGSSRPMVFDGFFGGVEVTNDLFPFLSLVGEYDSSTINLALKTTILKHFHFSFGLLDMNAFSGFFAYRFNLSNR